MDALIVVLRVLAVSQLLVFAGVLIRTDATRSAKCIGVGFVTSVCAYLLLPILFSIGAPSAIMTGLVWLANLVPIALFLVAWLCFEDHPPPAIVWYGLAALAAIMAWLQLVWATEPAALQALKLGTTCGSIVLAAREFRNDLVDQRRRARVVFISMVGAIVLSVLVVEFISGWQVPNTVERLGMGVIFLAAISTNIAVLTFNKSIDLGREPPMIPTRAATNEAAKRLDQMMRAHRLYADHDLRLNGFARHADMPEYQLRRTINDTLGFRNFNQFVNAYRIEEAKSRLKTERRTPVLTIALDVGFRSISSFNAAFKSTTGVTPTTFRRDVA